MCWRDRMTGSDCIAECVCAFSEGLAQHMWSKISEMSGFCENKLLPNPM
jgi:hypothetical protein